MKCSLFCLKGSQGLLQQFSFMGKCASQGTSGNLWRHIWLSPTQELGGCYWHLREKGWDGAKYPTMPRTASTQQLRKVSSER